MRISSLAFKFIGLLIVYLFACGALGVPGNAESHGQDILSCMLAPLRGITPLEVSALAAAIFLLGAGELFTPGAWGLASPGVRKSYWPSLLLLALVVNGLLILGIVAIILTGSSEATHPAGYGAYFVAGLAEAVLGIFLAGVLVFLRRPRYVFLPALGVLFAGIAALGAIFWLGKSALP